MRAQIKALLQNSPRHAIIATNNPVTSGCRVALKHAQVLNSRQPFTGMLRNAAVRLKQGVHLASLLERTACQADQQREAAGTAAKEKADEYPVAAEIPEQEAHEAFEEAQAIFIVCQVSPPLKASGCSSGEPENMEKRQRRGLSLALAHVTTFGGLILILGITVLP